MSALGVLGIILVVLKAFGVVTWSWWIVTAPFYVPAIIALLLFVLAILDGVAKRRTSSRGRR